MRSTQLKNTCLGVCLVLIFAFPYIVGAKEYSQIMVESSPPGAKVFIDDSFYGRTPMKLELAKGKHSLTLKKKGYQLHKEKIKVRQRKLQRITVKLVKQKRYGKLVIKSTPIGAKIFLNDRFYGKTPLNLELAVGQYLLHVKKKGHKPHKEKFNVRHHKVQRITVKLGKRKRYGKLEIDSTPSGAKLFIDGTFFQRTPALLSLEAGKHNIRMEKKGFNTSRDQIVIRNKERLRLNLKLTPEVHFSDLIVSSHPPGARIYIDDRYYDLTPARIKLRQGKYQIRVQKDNYHPSVRQVFIKRNKEARISFDLEPTEKYGFIEIVSFPSGCKVFIDDIFYDKTPLKLRLQGGKHRIKLKKRGWKTHTDKITIPRGENIHREFRLNKKIIPPPPKATLRVRSTPQGAMVMINETFHGTTPIDIALKAGVYHMEIHAKGFQMHRQRITLGSGELHPIWVELAEIEPLARYGQLHVIASKRAKVIIDGEYRGETPLTLRLHEGEHHLQLLRKHHQSFNDVVYIDGRQEHELDINLEWNGPDPYEPRPATIDIVSEPLSAKIFINKQYHGRTPQTLELPPGDYSLEIWHKGYHPFAQKMYVEPGHNQPVHAHLRWKGHENPAFLIQEIIKSVIEIE